MGRIYEAKRGLVEGSLAGANIEQQREKDPGMPDHHIEAWSNGDPITGTLEHGIQLLLE